MAVQDAVFELQQASCHLDDLEALLIGDKASDDFALSIPFGHILSHLNMAWHKLAAARNSAGHAHAISWETHSCVIPKLHGEWKLLPGLYANDRAAEVPQTATCRAMVSDLSGWIAALITKLETGAMAGKEASSSFCEAFERFNMAWHSLREHSADLQRHRMLTPNFMLEMQMEQPAA